MTGPALSPRATRAALRRALALTSPKHISIGFSRGDRVCVPPLAVLRSVDQGLLRTRRPDILRFLVMRGHAVFGAIDVDAQATAVAAPQGRAVAGFAALLPAALAAARGRMEHLRLIETSALPSAIWLPPANRLIAATGSILVARYLGQIRRLGRLTWTWRDENAEHA